MSHEDSDLVHRSRNGDLAAFRQLVDRHGARVHTIAYQLVGNAEDTRDIAQEVFLRVYQSLDRYNPEFPFEAWLYRLTVNLAIDYCRRNARHRNIAVDEVEDTAVAICPGPDIQTEKNELRGAICQLVGKLSANQRKTFVLRDLQNFSTDEVATILRCRPATVRVHLARARQQIGKALRKYYPELVADHIARRKNHEMP